MGNEFTGDVSALSLIAENIEVSQSNWVDGDMRNEPHLHFSAKIFAQPSHYGIEGGRISKLQVYRRGFYQEPKLAGIPYVEKSFYEYDRGPSNLSVAPNVQKFVDEMVRLLKV